MKKESGEGIIKVGILDAPKTFNPLVVNDVWEESVIHLIYDCLGISHPRSLTYQYHGLQKSGNGMKMIQTGE